MKRINSRGLDYSPAFGKKDYSILLFTTTRDGVVGDRISDQTGQPFADIWATEIEKKKRRSSRSKDKKKEEPRWGRPVSLGSIGTGDNEETINTATFFYNMQENTLADKLQAIHLRNIPHPFILISSYRNQSTFWPIHK